MRQITATDQRTLEQAQEPLATLKSFRKGEHLGLVSPPSLKSAVFFGCALLSHKAHGVNSVPRSFHVSL